MRCPVLCGRRPRPGSHEMPGSARDAYATPMTSGILNGLPQPPQTMGAWARTDGTTRTLRPQSHTALT